MMAHMRSPSAYFMLNMSKAARLELIGDRRKEFQLYADTVPSRALNENSALVLQDCPSRQLARPSGLPSARSKTGICIYQEIARGLCFAFSAESARKMFQEMVAYQRFRFVSSPGKANTTDRVPLIFKNS
jgi:hypothetical protein